MKTAMIFVIAEGLGQLKWSCSKDRSLKDLATFDASTRGPLGSVKLLWAVGPRNPFVSVGALVTILALSLDPTTQQVIIFHNQSTPSHGNNASVP
ncbi:hypothetical protein EJ08DRAFT_370732 [Tothia fuscella]|uniref:Uncharacterized protein n=1 Tax=Tothia fuscella TaxID=1048955 RepID=A0A9P4NLX3_9PEZI|nr:hypothetical protein EJ08DRAFT_370732 [Tothia fuscella]